MARTRAFIRYLKGKLVPGSLIFTNGEYPKGPFSAGKWEEIPVNQCCEIVTLSTRVTDPSISYVSIRFYCNNTSVDVEYGSQTSTNIESLVTILNDDFGEAFGTFSSTEDGAVILSMNTAKAKELCPNGHLSFTIFSD